MNEHSEILEGPSFVSEKSEKFGLLLKFLKGKLRLKKVKLE